MIIRIIGGLLMGFGFGSLLISNGTVLLGDNCFPTGDWQDALECKRPGTEMRTVSDGCTLDISNPSEPFYSGTCDPSDARETATKQRLQSMVELI